MAKDKLKWGRQMSNPAGDYISDKNKRKKYIIKCRHANKYTQKDFHETRLYNTSHYKPPTDLSSGWF